MRSNNILLLHHPQVLELLSWLRAAWRKKGGAPGHPALFRAAGATRASVHAAPHHPVVVVHPAQQQVRSTSLSLQPVSAAALLTNMQTSYSHGPSHQHSGCSMHTAATPPSKPAVVSIPTHHLQATHPVLYAVAAPAVDGEAPGTASPMGRDRLSSPLQPTQLEFDPAHEGRRRQAPSTIGEVVAETLPKLDSGHASYIQSVVKRAASSSVGMMAVGDVLVTLASVGKVTRAGHCITASGEPQPAAWLTCMQQVQ